jgi:hypothetical protein
LGEHNFEETVLGDTANGYSASGLLPLRFLNLILSNANGEGGKSSILVVVTSLLLKGLQFDQTFLKSLLSSSLVWFFK